jgi:tetratricopeptide (TPR) repeat protein
MTPAMKGKLVAALLVTLAFGPSAGRAAPGATSAGPNDFDRFQHVSPVNENAFASGGLRQLVAEGETALKSKRYHEAIARFDAAIQLKPPGDMALIILRLRSDAHIEQGDLDRALADANEMIRLDARNFRGYQVRGRTYRRKGKLDNAIADLNAALRLNPTFAQLYNNRGNVYSDKGQDQRAIEDFNKAIQLAPNVIDGYVNRGGSYYLLRNYRQAVADADQAIRLMPKDPDAYYNRGKAYEALGDLQKASADYEDAIRRNPEDFAGYEALAAVEAAAGDFVSAIKNQTHALSMKGVSASARREMQEHLKLYQAHKPLPKEHKSRKRPS